MLPWDQGDLKEGRRRDGRHRQAEGDNLRRHGRLRRSGTRQGAKYRWVSCEGQAVSALGLFADCAYAASASSGAANGNPAGGSAACALTGEIADRLPRDAWGGSRMLGTKMEARPFLERVGQELL